MKFNLYTAACTFRLAPCFPVRYDIEYASIEGSESSRPRSVERVVFERWNDAAKISEEVSIHWTEAFEWADANPAGGTVCAVILSDGSRAFASARTANPNHPRNAGRWGMTQVVVGAYGPAWLTRKVRQAAPPVPA